MSEPLAPDLHANDYSNYYEWIVLDHALRAVREAAARTAITGVASGLTTDTAPTAATWQQGRADALFAAADLVEQGLTSTAAAENDDETGPEFQETLEEAVTQLRELARRAAIQPPLF